MDLKIAFQNSVKQYAAFKGRAPRSEFWLFILGLLFGGLVTTLLDKLIFGSQMGLLNPLWGIITLVPYFAVIVRRLHDLNKSGWLVLFYHIFVILYIFWIFILGSYSDEAVRLFVVVLIGIGVFGFAAVPLYFFTLPGTKGPNQYGEDPVDSPSHDTGQADYPNQKSREQQHASTDPATRGGAMLSQTLSDYQGKILLVAASVIALMLVFPPTMKYNKYAQSYTNSYEFIFDLHDDTFVNIQVLLVQWLGIGLVTAIVYFVASKKRV